jgi:hypothetical protein
MIRAVIWFLCFSAWAGFFYVSGYTERLYPKEYTLKTDPPQFNPPIDTSRYGNIIFLPWDFQLFPFPLYCNTWYPACGGCIVYDSGWPLGNNFNHNDFPKDYESQSLDSSVVDTNKVRTTIADTTSVEDSPMSKKKLSRKEKWRKRLERLHFFRKK